MTQDTESPSYLRGFQRFEAHHISTEMRYDTVSTKYSILHSSTNLMEQKPKPVNYQFATKKLT